MEDTDTRGIRHAEKTRKSAQLPIADEIARVSIELFRSSQSIAKQTVLSSFVAVNDEDCVRVLSYGAGTKVAPVHTILDDEEQGIVLRDMHAEVLARRAFVRHCYEAAVPVLSADERLFLYTSSMPCGNSTIRRWARVRPPPDDPMLLHEALHVFAPGQIDLLCKRHPSTDKILAYEDPSNRIPWLPNGCTSTKHSALSHTCSDKIARWVALGPQGALLSKYMDPLRIHGIVMGRKFSYEHARRALCCRIPSIHKSMHPLLLGTPIKLDDTIFQSERDGAVFDSRCYAWWPSLGLEPEVIDGTTGKRFDGTPSALCKRDFFCAWRSRYAACDEHNPSLGCSYREAKRNYAAEWYHRDRAAFFAQPPFSAWNFADQRQEQFCL